MKLDYQSLLPEDFSPRSRVWIYQSSRLLSLGEALQMEPQLEEFAKEWTAHGAQVKASAHLFFGQFVVLIADETNTGVSGCSTDASVRFIKSLEQQYRTDFFNRTSLAFIIKDKVQVLPMSQVAYAFENGFINPDTLYFNNLAATLAELRESWIVPVKDSWLASRLPSVNS